MSRRALEKSVRMFRALCEDTMQRGGSTPLGAQGVASLLALEEVLGGKRRFEGTLLKPLAAFAHLLASGELPPGFARLNFGDVVLAVSETMAHDPPGWKFDPALTPGTAARLGLDTVLTGIDRLAHENDTGWKPHAEANARFILAAADSLPRRERVVIAGGARAYDVPLAELAGRFERLVVTDVCAAAAEETVRERVPQERRSRVRVELFDLTGSYNRFAAAVDVAVTQAKNVSDAERAVVELCGSYDTPSSAARISTEPVEADLAISSMVLSQLGVAYKSYVEKRFLERGWEKARVRRAPLEPALSTLAALVEQHHIAALLAHAGLVVLTSDVSGVVVVARTDGSVEATGEAQEQLSVDALCDRIPGRTQIVADASWEWPRVLPDGKTTGMTMRVDAIAMRRRA